MLREQPKALIKGFQGIVVYYQSNKQKLDSPWSFDHNKPLYTDDLFNNVATSLQ